MDNTHRGKVIQDAVKKSGYKIIEITKKLGISRNTLYYKFSNAKVDYDFIIRLGHVINHDFSISFPEINFNRNPKATKTIEAKKVYEQKLKLSNLEKKYDNLRKKVDHLIDLFSFAAEDEDFAKIKKETKSLLTILEDNTETQKK